MRRHKVALALPVLLAFAMASWYAVSQPHKYMSTTSVWFDTSVPNASSIQTPQSTSPASTGQSVLEELLGTRQFLVAVGHRGPLADYLSTHPATKSGPSALLGDLGSLAGRGSGGAPSLDDRVVSTLAPAFSVATSGPQVIKLTMTSPYPSVMQGTLQAVVDQYKQDLVAELSSRSNASVSYYQAQLDSAHQALEAANASVVAYESTHANPSTLTDPVYAQLVQVAFSAQSAYTNLQSSYQQAALAGHNLSSFAAFHTLDPPQAPVASARMKKVVFISLAGLIVGLVISALALAAYQALDKTARDAEDVEAALGLEVVTSIRPLETRSRPEAVNGIPS